MLSVMIKDPISIMIASDQGAPDTVDQFSRDNGFVRFTCDLKGELPDVLAKRKIDILLIAAGRVVQSEIESLLEQIQQINEKTPDAVFLAVNSYPDTETRHILYQKGCSQIFVFPLTADEIKSRYEIYRRNAELVRERLYIKEKLDKSRQYLETFKVQLKTTKAELYDERLSLNNALKQINRMTEERDRLKKQKKEISVKFVQNIEGFYRILVDLVRNQVEKNRGHGERVAHVASFVGKEFNMDEKMLEDLSKAAMLHEVGLLFMPAAALGKPENLLDAYEKDLFLQYPMKGADLLRKCSGLDNPAQIIQSLNENSDGTGYPSGLKRRYIPLPSRILAGADVFDTLKDDADVHDFEGFLKALENFSGTRLDPGVVAVLQKYAVLHMGSDNYRVKGLGIHQLEPGMVLGTAIFSSTGTKLFSVNTLLTQDAIDKIKKYNKEYPVDETVYIRA